MMKEIKDYTIIELKAMAYDCLAQIESLQTKMNGLNKIIAQKFKEQPIKEEKTEESA